MEIFWHRKQVIHTADEQLCMIRIRKRKFALRVLTVICRTRILSVHTKPKTMKPKGSRDPPVPLLHFRDELGPSRQPRP